MDDTIIFKLQTTPKIGYLYGETVSCDCRTFDIRTNHSNGQNTLSMFEIRLANTKLDRNLCQKFAPIRSRAGHSYDWLQVVNDLGYLATNIQY